MATPADPEFFAMLPLSMDPQTKAVSVISPSSSTSTSTSTAAQQPQQQQQQQQPAHQTPKALEAELQKLNALHRSLQQNLDAAVAPPAPIPVKPQRSQQIGKLRDAANAALRKAGQQSNASSNPSPEHPAANDALRLYTLALDMAAQRPAWEPAGLLREELAQLYGLRAGAHMAARRWADAYTDVRLSLECKKMGNPGAWVKGGKCLVEMGRVGEAREWVQRGLEGERAAVEGARAQVSQAQGPQVAGMREGLRGLEREVEELREVGRGVGVGVGR